MLGEVMDRDSEVNGGIRWPFGECESLWILFLNGKQSNPTSIQFNKQTHNKPTHPIPLTLLNNSECDLSPKLNFNLTLFPFFQVIYSYIHLILQNQNSKSNPTNKHLQCPNRDPF